MNRIAKKGVAVGLLFVLVAAMFVIVLPMNVGASWTGDVTIKSDGSVDPSTAPISVSGTTYTLTDDIYGKITIEKPGIILDGDGYTLQGSGSGFGIYLASISDVTMTNLNIKGFTVGVRLEYSSDNTINENTISGNVMAGIAVWWESNNNIISENTVTKNSYGIGLFYSSNYNTISQNTVRDNKNWGIRFNSESNNNVLNENTIRNNGGTGIDVYFWSDYNTISKNTVKNNGLDGIVILYECYYNIISDNTVMGNSGDGIVLSNFVSGNTVTRNTISGNGDGVSYGDGIFFLGSDNNIITENTVKDNDFAGLRMVGFKSMNNIIKQNTFKTNADGGIILWGAKSNTITENKILDNTNEGILLTHWYYPSVHTSTDNIITKNTILRNDVGIDLSETSVNNEIYYNNILKNDDQANDDAANTWDDSVGMGNYWSDYSGSDADDNGIGDTSYVIDFDSQDNYPLMDQY